MKNPYPTRPGFGLRVRYATNALKNLALGNDEAIDRRSKETYSRVHSRQMDNCFEMHDGKAVVWELMHIAAQEPDLYGQSLITKGINQFCGKSGIEHWQNVYAGTAETTPRQLEMSVSNQMKMDV